MFKKLFDLIKGFFASAFVKRVTNIIVNTIKQIGQEKFDALRNYVQEVGTQPISGEEKMRRVLAYASQMGIGLKESAIRALVENIIQDIKKG